MSLRVKNKINAILKNNKDNKLKYESAKICFAYLIICFIWIYLFDLIVSKITVNNKLFQVIETSKGFAYLLITGVIFYLLIYNFLKRIYKAEEKLNKSYEELSVYNKSLRIKYNEILKSKDKLSKSEEKYKDLVHKMEYLSYRDQMTGLYNRRFFEEELRRLDVERNLPLSLIMADVNGLKLINDSFGHVMGDELIKTVANIMRTGCRQDDIIGRLGGDEFVILLHKTNACETEQVVHRLKNMASKEKIGFMDVSVSFGFATKNNKEEKIEEVLKNAEDYMYKKKLFQRQSMREKTIDAIISTLYEKNKIEEKHSHSVLELCESLGKSIGLSESEIGKLKNAGLLHDIGKIAIEDNLLNKPNELTVDEYNEIKRHPEIGYRMLSTVNDMSEVAQYVLYHHENWNGRGYPKGLKEEEIPLYSRIISIVGAYDAMTYERSYHKAMPKELAIKELKKSAGIQFDPELVKIFIDKVLHRKE